MFAELCYSRSAYQRRGPTDCNITPRAYISNISSISELIQPFLRSVYAETGENSRNEVSVDVREVMDVREVVLQCLQIGLERCPNSRDFELLRDGKNSEFR